MHLTQCLAYTECSSVSYTRPSKKACLFFFYRRVLNSSNYKMNKKLMFSFGSWKGLYIHGKVKSPGFAWFLHTSSSSKSSNDFWMMTRNLYFLKDPYSPTRRFLSKPRFDNHLYTQSVTRAQGLSSPNKELSCSTPEELGHQTLMQTTAGDGCAE